MGDTTYYYQQPPPAYATPQYPVHHQPRHTSHWPSVEASLVAAFPNIDRATVTAILTSASGQYDRAYNALSAISDTSPPSSTLRPQQYDSIPLPSYSYAPSSPVHVPQQSPASKYQQPSGYEQPQSTSQQNLSNISSNPPAVSPQISRAHVETSNSPSYLPDMTKLNLHEPGPTHQQIPIHYANCDGCNADPIKGNRWHCVVCADYDLCDDCKTDGVHNNHKFISLRPSIEFHREAYCDGCKSSDKTLYGTRFICLKHKDEDWCEYCVGSGRACSGPFKEFKQSALGYQLEDEHCIPMPEDWKCHLMPGVSRGTYNVQRSHLSGNWLSSPTGLEWYGVAYRDRDNKSVGPDYKLEHKTTKGRLVSDHKFSWTMIDLNGKKLYSYLLEKDRKTFAIKNEKFGEYNGRSFTPVWDHGMKRDSLSFEDPKSGKRYRWISNRPISTCGDERFDFQRMALFEQRNGKEVIVADWTWWDGHSERPEDCMTIRDPNIDHALVLATMSIVFIHQWQIMIDESERDCDAVQEAEIRARLTPLGLQSYWGAGDFQSSGQGGHDRMSSAQKWKIANQFLGAFNEGLSGAQNSYAQGVDLGNAVSACVDSSGGGGGGCDSSGGGSCC